MPEIEVVGKERATETAARLLRELVEPHGYEAEDVTVVVGTLDQPRIAALVSGASLSEAIEHDGYGFGWVDAFVFVVYALIPRGLVYACGYELPRRIELTPRGVAFPAEAFVTTPTDRIRAFRYWTTGGEDFVPDAAVEFRLNAVWIASDPIGECSFAHMPSLAAYASRHAPRREELRARTERVIDTAHEFGLEIYVGGSYQLWHLPDELYGELCRAHPALTANIHYAPSSPWPPAPWMDRPMLCICHPLVQKLHRGIVDEFLTMHPSADAYGSGFGYDGYPFAASCAECGRTSFAERMRLQAQMLYDVAVTKHKRKLACWTWAGGPLLAIPGYRFYYDWLVEFVAQDPEHILPAIFAVHGDFNPVYKLNPFVGTRGPNDAALLLTWHDYRGDSVVPAWLVEWMADSFPRLREQGGGGFYAMEAYPDKRITDPVHRAELACFGLLTWDGDRSAASVAEQYCRELLPTLGDDGVAKLARALSSTGSITDQALFTDEGIRLARHCEIDEDLRMLWEVSVLADSGPFVFDDAARARAAAHSHGILEGVDRELSWVTGTDCVSRILRRRARAVSRAVEVEKSVRAVASAATSLSRSDQETLAHIAMRCGWLVSYARLLEGYASVLLLLKGLWEEARGGAGVRVPVGSPASVIADAAAEIEQALAELPTAAQIRAAGVYPYWSENGPWHLPGAAAFIDTLRSVSRLVRWAGGSPYGDFPTGDAASPGAADNPGLGARLRSALVVLHAPWAQEYLGSLYLPHTLAQSTEELLRGEVMIAGSSAEPLISAESERVLERVAEGALLYLDWSTPDPPIAPLWLPGAVGLYRFSADETTVVTPNDPMVAGYAKLHSEPVPIRGKERPRQAIRAYANGGAPWRLLTYPATLLSCEYGAGRIVINLIPDNRRLFFRVLGVGVD